MENLGILLSKNPDLIYLLMKKIDVEIKKILPFGPSNSSDIEPLFFNTAQEDILSLKFKKSLNSFERARLLVKAEQGCVRIEKPPFLNRYIRGMGVCNHFNFFALMILAKEYDFLAMLENIFSDESHTYVVLFASNLSRTSHDDCCREGTEAAHIGKKVVKVNKKMNDFFKKNFRYGTDSAHLLEQDQHVLLHNTRNQQHKDLRKKRM